jgi:hypothetical protein
MKLPVWVRVQPQATKRTSVQDDWRAWLTPAKAQVFSLFAEDLETRYTILSISLNEAIELRRDGLLGKALQTLSITSALCARLSHPLRALLHVLGDHAKYYGTIPKAAPLSPSNFQGAKEQRTAKMNDLLSRVLLTQRSQFLHKISDLENMVEDLGKEFQVVVEELATGLSIQSNTGWAIVDAAHYDLNSCLRESIILLKSFLLALPNDQLGVFQKAVTAQIHASTPQTISRQKSTRHRRIATIA